MATTHAYISWRIYVCKLFHKTNSRSLVSHHGIMGVMATVKIKRSTRPGKTWMVTYENPKTGRQKTVHGGQKGVKTGKARTPETRKAFIARHGKPATAKQYVNARLWKDKKVGDTVRIPSKLL